MIGAAKAPTDWDIQSRFSQFLSSESSSASLLVGTSNTCMGTQSSACSRNLMDGRSCCIVLPTNIYKPLKLTVRTRFGWPKAPLSDTNIAVLALLSWFRSVTDASCKIPLGMSCPTELPWLMQLISIHSRLSLKEWDSSSPPVFTEQSRDIHHDPPIMWVVPPHPTI